jgi:hypothetical protein
MVTKVNIVTMIIKVAVVTKYPGDSQSLERAETRVGLHICCSCPALAGIGMCRQVLVRLPKIKFHENPFSRFRVDTCRQAHRLKIIGEFFATYSCKRDLLSRYLV